MRKYHIIFICSLIVGCSPMIPPNQSEQIFNYSDFYDKKILWNQLLEFENSYFVLVYADYCLHCQNIKQKIFEFFMSYNFPFFLCEYTADIPLGPETSFTIGEDNLSNIFILGVPTLFYITDKSVSLNLAGETEITDYIDSFHND